MITSEEERSILLHAAREAIRSLFEDEVRIPVVDFSYYPELKKKDAGAFVTLTKNGKLNNEMILGTAPNKRFLDSQPRS